MKPILRAAFLTAAVTMLASCGTMPRKPTHRPTTTHKIRPMRVGSIGRTKGSQELMLYSMGLINTPYRWGGNKTEMSFDCSGMIQFVYKDVLDVSLPRTARDMAIASRKIPDGKLKAGNLVFFSTGGAYKYSHVGLYIGNGELIYAPSSGKTVQTEKLSKPFYAKNYLGVHTLFTD